MSCHDPLETLQHCLKYPLKVLNKSLVVLDKAHASHLSLNFAEESWCLLQQQSA